MANVETLTLALKGEYFDQIKAGVKTEEFRLVSPYWEKRLVGRQYGAIELTRGYPSRDDVSKRIVLPWQGYRVTIITHPHFGNDPVEVFAINVKEPERPAADWSQAPEGTTHVIRSPWSQWVAWVMIASREEAFWRWPGAKNWRPSSETTPILLQKPYIEAKPISQRPQT